MSDLIFDSSYFSENVSNLTHKSNNSNKMVNLKKDIFSTKTYNKIDGSNKSLLIVEKLSKQKGKFRRSRFGLNNDELKLGTTNKSNIVDYNKDLAFNLANVIVRRRFKYFWGKRDDSGEEEEIQKPIKVEKKSRIIVDMKKIEEERKRKEREERERKEKERIERELREKERMEKEKKKELMKTIEINVEERKRQNHNYKIIQKITKEIEVTNNDINNKYKNKEEPQKKNQKKNFSANHFKAYNDQDKNRRNKTHVVKNIRPEIKAQRIVISREDNNNNRINNINQVKIEVNKKTVVKESVEIPSLLNRTNNIHQIKQIITHESNLGKDSKIENKKIIIVNKRGNVDKNNEVNKIVVQKNVVKRDININQYENYKTEGNVRNKYKNMKNNKIISSDI